MFIDLQNESWECELFQAKECLNAKSFPPVWIYVWCDVTSPTSWGIIIINLPKRGLKFENTFTIQIDSSQRHKEDRFKNVITDTLMFSLNLPTRLGFDLTAFHQRLWWFHESSHGDWKRSWHFIRLGIVHFKSSGLRRRYRNLRFNLHESKISIKELRKFKEFPN